MNRFVCNAITLFSLLAFSAHPGLCECVQNQPKDHGCCHEETNHQAPKHSCPDESHLCVLSCQNADLVVWITSTVSLENDVTETRNFTSLAHSFSASTYALNPPPLQLWTHPQISSYFVLSTPTRGPPFRTA